MRSSAQGTAVRMLHAVSALALRVHRFSASGSCTAVQVSSTAFEVSYLQHLPHPRMAILNYIAAFEKEIRLLILLRTLCLSSDTRIGLSAWKTPAF